MKEEVEPFTSPPPSSSPSACGPQRSTSLASPSGLQMLRNKGRKQDVRMWRRYVASIPGLLLGVYSLVMLRFLHSHLSASTPLRISPSLSCRLLLKSNKATVELSDLFLKYVCVV
ncbi:uncharacterized protein [Triticum aestivum]|uniref:uncharacterized protein n=1 Tax=Triticum aestivum TaxID=4565 RepID=UPI001D019522|nr:uncharacterized protein LOC123096061 [Triticum aestivum]